MVTHEQRLNGKHCRDRLICGASTIAVTLEGLHRVSGRSKRTDEFRRKSSIEFDREGTRNSNRLLLIRQVR
jgi:hypothetical protein